MTDDRDPSFSFLFSEEIEKSMASNSTNRLIVILLFVSALALALGAEIVAYVVSRDLKTAMGWGGASAVFVLTSGPPLVKLWVQGP
ncbi:hypothetical protein [Streptomyces sp. NPDC056690]|uniref:hypothetical protein n=1 Tax=unclassified Streptomyces TaxID=2593676 RepID=UPI00363AE30B